MLWKLQNICVRKYPSQDNVIESTQNLRCDVWHQQQKSFEFCSFHLNYTYPYLPEFHWHQVEYLGDQASMHVHPAWTHQFLCSLLSESTFSGISYSWIDPSKVELGGISPRSYSNQSWCRLNDQWDLSILRSRAEKCLSNVSPPTTLTWIGWRNAARLTVTVWMFWTWSSIAWKIFWCNRK